MSLRLLGIRFMLASLFAVLAPVFIVAGIGYGWARRGLDYPTEFIARIVMTVGTPSLVLSTLSRTQLDPQPSPAWPSRACCACWAWRWPGFSSAALRASIGAC